MDCKEVKESLFLFVDHEMDEDRRIPFRDHIARCTGCSKKMNYTLKLILIVRQRCVRCNAPAALRHRLDSKIVTTQLGNAAGVPSVPNVLGRAASYPELLALADRSGLGHDLVVQMPYGDSGKTTFFIAAEEDWDATADDIRGQQLKIMKRDRKSTRLNSSHEIPSRMPSSA